MPFERAYTKKDLAMDIFMPDNVKLKVEKALQQNKPVKIVHSSFNDKGADYSEVILDGVVVHHQKGY